MMGKNRGPALLQLHRWTGLGAGLLFIAVAITGAGLVFRAQLEPVLVPSMAVPPCSAPLTLDALAASARSASPGGGALKMVRLYDNPVAPARLRLSDGRWIYIDRCSGKVTGSQALYEGPFGTVARVHIFLYPGVSELAAGCLAVLLALSIIAGGIVVLRPARMAHLKRGLAFRRGLHQGLALYAAPILLVSAVTGMAQTFEWGTAPAPVPKAAVQGSSLPLARLLARAEDLVPHARKIQIRLPGGAGAPITFEIVASDAPHANAFSYVYLDPASGALLGHVPHAANRVGHKLYLLGAGIHYGWVGGLAGQLLLLAGALSVPVLAWTGTASFLRTRRRNHRMRLVVAKKTLEADGVCSFELVDPRGKPLPPFSAGAHLDVHMRPGLVRQYSLCNNPQETHRYLIGVLKTPGSRGGSRSMHEAVQQGDTLEVGIPRNHFPLAPSARRSLLFAGGIGVTPILSMAEHLAARGAGFELHYCARSPAHAAFREYLTRAPYARQVHFHYGERADLAALLAAPSEGTHLYVCGPAGFMDAVIATALAQGWRDDHLHREYFSGAAPKADDKAFDVRIASSGKIIHVPGGTTVTEALDAHGIAIPTSCGSGVCGTCVTRVLEGEPEHRDQCLSPAEKRSNGWFTPCCSRASSAMLTLDL
jgi:ferredoxin-NADP reductase